MVRYFHIRVLHVENSSHDIDYSFLLYFPNQGTKNSEVVYALVSGEFSRNFSIDSRQGVITPTTPLDYEALPISQGHKETSVRPLRLTVRARDMGSPSLSSDAPLIIYLKDINDNTPAFERTLYKRSIPEDLPGGTSVVQVLLHSDQTLYRKFTYETRGEM